MFTAAPPNYLPARVQPALAGDQTPVREKLVHFFNRGALARQDEIRGLNRVGSQGFAELPRLIKQGVERGMEGIAVVLLDRCLEVSVEMVELVDRAIRQPQLSLAHDPDDH